VMKPDGTNQRRLTSDGGVKSPPEWSPDGSRLAFEGTRVFPRVHLALRPGPAKRPLHDRRGRKRPSPPDRPLRRGLLVAPGRCPADVVARRLADLLPLHARAERDADLRDEYRRLVRGAVRPVAARALPAGVAPGLPPGSRRDQVRRPASGDPPPPAIGRARRAERDEPRPIRPRQRRQRDGERRSGRGEGSGRLGVDRRGGRGHAVRRNRAGSRLRAAGPAAALDDRLRLRCRLARRRIVRPHHHCEGCGAGLCPAPTASTEAPGTTTSTPAAATTLSWAARAAT
jgi:hypothetical protein